MTFNEIKLLTSTCWNERYQPLVIDKTKDKYTGRHSLGLEKKANPDSFLFSIKKLSFYHKVIKKAMIKLAELSEQRRIERPAKIESRFLKQTSYQELAETFTHNYKISRGE